MAVHLGPPSGDAADQPFTGPGAPPESVNDPTTVSGQDPASLFGVPISYDSGAPGSAGQSVHPEGGPTIQPGQVYEGISGLGPDAIADSGAPGGATANPGYDPAPGPGGNIVITDPNYTAGRPGGGSGNQFISVHATTSGPLDSTVMPGQYVDHASNNLPALNQPADTGAGRGTALHGGFMRGKRPGERA